MLEKISQLALTIALSGIVIGVHAQSCITATSHLIDNNNGTVSDPRTGLIWKKCAEGQIYNSNANNCSSHDSGVFTWTSALQQVGIINTSGVGENFGKTDWRLPNVKELLSIVDSSCTQPVINEVFFPNLLWFFDGMVETSTYWSSSAYVKDGNYAWTVEFSNGDVSPERKDYSYNHTHVRLVRDYLTTVEQPVSQYIRDDLKESVLDSHTGFTWQDNVNITRNWNEALSYCSTLTLGRKSDWRLPSKDEILTMLLDGDRHIDEAFINTVGNFHWTSSVPSDPDASNYGTKARYVHFENGGKYYSSKNNNFNVLIIGQP